MAILGLHFVFIIPLVYNDISDNELF